MSKFKNPMQQAMFETCLRLAADNFSEFYYSHRPGERYADAVGKSGMGPRWPRRGAGHRHAFWNGYFGAYRPDGSPTAVPGSLAWAAFRAGEAFRKARGAQPCVDPRLVATQFATRAPR
jgi:hypothetical protein